MVVGGEVVGSVGPEVVEDEGFLGITLGVREVFADDLEVVVVALELV